MRLLSGLLVGLGLVLGCGGDDGVSPAETARAELADRGIAYTERVFLDAARHGALAVVRLFVQAGMDVNAADEYGWTALYFAAWKGHLDVVEFLVGAGADLAATTNFGDTALHEAAREGDLDVVKFLVGAGASVNAKNNVGSTALYFAAWKGHLEMVQYLVGQGASVRATGINGWTPRDVAAHCSTSRLYGSSAMANCGAVVEYFDSL